ncbi:carbohydrate ABC transporter substrate-binding protein (CUT1 family) [Hasllibacter halocynthiae]|uniref:Carbohydrate ABC transporter substrate-binding protein (CUT1 family) n=1 Tax=Hasllibacter halocynthiae TaxID=595589 RepID=A0A2T0X425_9RHOB|nr:extracellular solute-binding protein [Hasllibacter halocynthiae]PRY93703.1 carbohydrate ABC transporter substrate-binding protein (CUT1 family) [Hasllibacter halocynthiae]
MTVHNTLSGAAALALIAGGALADASCPLDEGRVSVLGNEFPAIQAVVARAAECASDVQYQQNLTTEHKNIQVPALTANPAEYTSAVVANGTLVPLLNEGLVRPLDDLIAEHGEGVISPAQVITVDGQAMAVAFMANAQHLFVRQDILDEVGMEVPTTYEEVLDLLEAIREAGIMEDPFVANTAVGWNLAEEFVNMYSGYGGEFFEPGTANLAIDNEAGVAALEMMAALNEYAGPDFLTYDSNATSALWAADEAAVGILWGSRATEILGEDTPEEIREATVLAAAPTVGETGIPASTLWWDGFTIASNVSDEDAEATFVAMASGIEPAVLEGNEDAAVWLIEGFEPGKAAAGVAATAAAGARPYPMVPYMGLLHTALGNELSDFMQGNESAEQALADVGAAYEAAAREQGFLE